MPQFYTAVRGRVNDQPGTIYYMEGHDQGEHERHKLKLDDESGDLFVYIGTFLGYDGRRPRQVVIGCEQPLAGAQDETFELVFCGPAAMAWEIFDAHVGMLP